MSSSKFSNHSENRETYAFLCPVKKNVSAVLKDMARTRGNDTLFKFALPLFWAFLSSVFCDLRTHQPWMMEEEDLVLAFHLCKTGVLATFQK